MRVTPHVHALKIPFQIPLAPGRMLDRFVYAYVIEGERLCLIDSGVAGAEQGIFAYLGRIGRRPEEIRWLLLTHAHPDHIGSAKAIKDRTGCLIAASPLEQAWVEDVQLQRRQRPIPGFDTLVGGSVGVDRLLREGQRLEVDAALTLDVIETPGHSAGSLSFVLREERVLFSGDAVLLPGFLPIYDDLAGCVASLAKLRAVKDAELLCSSWDDPRTGADVARRLDDSLGYFRQLHAVVKKHAGSAPGMPAMELCKRVVAELGLPDAALNPLIAASLQASLGANRDDP